MSFLKIILIAISLPLISSEDLCQLIAPNGSFKGLGIYKRYEYKEFLKAVFLGYWMYNKQGMEWKVMFEINETNDVNIEVDYQSIQAINTSIIKRLGLFTYPIKDWPRFYVFNCDVFRSQGKANDLEVDCRNIFDTSSGSHLSVRDVNDLLDSVFIHQKIPLALPSHYILVNKTNKTIHKYFHYDGKLEAMITLPCNQMTCSDIRFIEQMDDSLVRQIDSTVDYNIGLTFKHFLLFDINGRPYYCVQTECINISEQVCDQTLHSLQPNI